MTGRDVVTAALKKIGALAPSESIAASEASDGLAELNRMLGSWSNEGLLIYAITAETPLTLTPSQATYTLGISGSITTRPQKIEKALIRDGTLDLPVNVLLSLSEFAAIALKSMQSTYPTDLYDDGGYPRRTITLYPVPSAAKSLVLFTKRALTAISTLDTAVSLPPGYEDAMVWNLAERLAPEYGKALSEVVMMKAIDTKAAIKNANHKPSYLRCDDALVSGGMFNIITGGPNR